MMRLFKIFYAAFKEQLVLLEGNILIEVVALAFAVSHLAEHPAVGRGDALDGTDRTVDIVSDVASGLAAQINILRGELTVLSELVNGFLVSEEASLSVRDGNGEHVACLNACQPR